MLILQYIHTYNHAHTTIIYIHTYNHAHTTIMLILARHIGQIKMVTAKVDITLANVLIMSASNIIIILEMLYPLLKVMIHMHCLSYRGT